MTGWAQSVLGGQAGVGSLTTPICTQVKLGGQSLSAVQVWAEALAPMARPTANVALETRSLVAKVMGKDLPGQGVCPPNKAEHMPTNLALKGRTAKFSRRKSVHRNQISDAGGRPRPLLL
ncbi:MAG TPA: hypothetical protein VH374_18240 [Polyangia bacterium]|nr:hypothetical protein [Polyangia bacterium]